MRRFILDTGIAALHLDRKRGVYERAGTEVAFLSSTNRPHGRRQLIQIFHVHGYRRQPLQNNTPGFRLMHFADPVGMPMCSPNMRSRLGVGPRARSYCLMPIVLMPQCGPETICDIPLRRVVRGKQAYPPLCFRRLRMFQLMLVAFNVTELCVFRAQIKD